MQLTPAQEAVALTRRKEIYETLFPETRHGAIGGGHPRQSRQNGDSDRFTKETAAASGKSERVVQRMGLAALALWGDERPSSLCVREGAILAPLIKVASKGNLNRFFD